MILRYLFVSMMLLIATLLVNATFLSQSDGDSTGAPSLHVAMEHQEVLDSKAHISNDSLLSAVAGIPQISGFIVYQHDEIQVEQYWRGNNRNRHQNIKSASKSIISTLVGLAIEQGHIESIDDPIEKYLPKYFEGLQPAEKRKITVRHLLTMSSGLESTSFGNYGRWVVSSDWVRAALAGNLLSEPGTQMRYSTGDTHILSAVITAATGVSTREYAERELFRKLGVRIGGWDRDPQGIYFGGNNMSMNPAGLLAYGRLHLEEGFINGEQLVSKEWILQTMSRRYNAISYNSRGHNYGYLWWNNTFGGHEAWFAWGYGGQYVFVMPSLDAIVVITGNPDTRRRGVNNVIYQVMDEAIVPYLAAN
jgi:CubicO group peptidase (beta-lactamase class C family)